MPRTTAASRLEAGWARADITPSPALPMAGYLARERPARGALDPLEVRCLALRQGRRRAVLVLIDWLLVESRWCNALRAELARRHGLPRSAVIVAATHTHAGPAVPTGPFVLGMPPDDAARAYWQHARRRMQTAAAQALAALRPVEVAWARGAIGGIAGDRNRPRRWSKQPVLALRLRPRDGGAAAMLAVYGCHPTVLGPDNDRYSGDLLGAMARGLEASGFACALVANGAAANLSTRFTRQERTPAQVGRFAAAALGQLCRLRWRRPPAVRLRMIARSIELPLRSREEAAAGPSAGEGAQVWAALRRSRLFAANRLGIEIVLWRLGPFTLAALPLEIFADTGAFLWRQARMQVLGYANGYWGYLPSPSARANDYETVSSPFNRDGDRRLRFALTRSGL